jgi:WD40 repeat protein
MMNGRLSEMGNNLEIENNQSPYVGPRPFNPEDSEFFFGRDAEADKLLSLITAHPVVLLYSPSGAGKTSLLNARLIPLLRREGFDVLPPARVQSQTQINLAFEEIENIFVFNAIMDWCRGESNQAKFAGKSLAEFLKDCKCPEKSNVDKGGAEEPTPRVVIFDQFEEILRLYPERWEDRYAFFEQVRDAITPQPRKKLENGAPRSSELDPLLRVVFVMREDYIAGLDTYMHLLPEKLRTRFRLEHLREKAANLAVTEPLKGTAKVFEEGVAEELVKNLLKVPSMSPGSEWETGQYVEPLQLQVVCDSLWLALAPDDLVITREHLNKHGDVNEALSAFYERSIKNVAAKTGEAEGHLRMWFGKKLIRAEGVRGIVYRGSTHTAELSNSAVDELDRLHLIKGELKGTAHWYELAHDRLITPIRSSNEKWIASLETVGQTWRHLENRADEWNSRGRGSQGLFDEADLRLVNVWMTECEKAALSPSKNLLDMIKASQSAQSFRSKRRLSLAVAALLLVVAGMGILLMWALQERADARRLAKDLDQKREESYKSAVVALKAKEDAVDRGIEANNASYEATVQRAKAERERDTAQTAQAYATRQRKSAEAAHASAVQAKTQLADRNRELTTQSDELKRAEKEARAGELAAHAISQLLYDPQLSLLLALEAADLSPSATHVTETLSDALRQSYLKANDRAVLTGHSKTVWQAAFSPDGRAITTISEDETVRVWNATTGATKGSLEKHGGPVHALEISRDGNLLATEAADSTGRIWDARTGNQLFTLEGLNGPVAALAFSHDGTRLITETCDEDKKVWQATIWDTTNGAAVRNLLGHNEAISAVAFSPDGKLVATASWDHTARLWRADTGTLVAVLSGHTEPVNSVTFSPKGEYVFTTSFDSTARMWEVPTGRFIRELRGHGAGAVHSATFSRDGKFVVTTSRRLSNRQIMVQRAVPLTSTVKYLATEGLTARIWEVQTGRRVASLWGHEGDVYTAEFSPDNRLVVTASEDGMARVWEAATGKRLMEMRGHTGPVYNATFSHDGKFIVTSSKDGTARIWETTPGGRVMELMTQNDQICRARFDAEGKSAVVTQRAGSSQVKVNTREILREWKRNEAVYDTAVSPDGKLIVSASRIVQPDTSCLSIPPTRAGADEDRKARVWEAATGKMLIELSGHSRPVIAAVFSPDSRFLVTASADYTARVWDVATGRSVTTLNGHVWVVVNAAFSPDGNSVVTASGDGTARIWETATGKFLTQLYGHRGPVLNASFSPDGKYVITASDDGTARAWTATGDLVMEIRGHTGAVNSAVFSPDGKWIVTASDDNSVLVWDAATGERVMAMRGHTDAVYSAAFGPDNTTVITGSADGTAQVFGCEVCLSKRENLHTLTLTRKTRDLTPEERCKYLLHQPVGTCKQR